MSVDPRARSGAPDDDVGTGVAERNLAFVLVLDQRFDFDDLYRVRAVVAAHAAELGLSLELTNDVVIAVHELASNSVRHGPGCGRLRVWATPQTLICEVADGVVAQTQAVLPAQITSSSVAATELPWPVESGHGLWLIGKVADGLTVRRDDHGSTVTIRFVVRP